MKKFEMKRAVIIGAALALVGGAALAQTIWPLYPALTGKEIIKDEANATGAFFTTQQVAQFGGSLAGAGQGNALVGGDFSANLFQRGTSITSITTGPTFGPDRWFAWSGTSTGLTLAKDTTAGDFPVTASAAASLTRTGSGVVQSCVGQDVTTANSLRFAGQTAEFDFHALAASGFSAASSNLQAYVVYGTGTSEGAAKMAYTINAGGGGTPGWTNGTIAASPLVKISATLNRYTVAAAIPAKVTTSPVTEVGVALCWTPVGASPSSDGFSFSLAQLLVNSTLTPSATTYLTNSTQARSFVRRLAAEETRNQLAYYWEQDEAASSTVAYGVCQGLASTTAANCIVNFPVPMFTVPTLAYTAGTIRATANTAGAAAPVTALAITSGGGGLYSAALTATVTSAATITGLLEAGNSTGGGKIAFSAEP